MAQHGVGGGGVAAQRANPGQQLRLVGPGIADVRVRPVGAPDRAVRRGVQQGARHAHGIEIGRDAVGDAVRPGELDPQVGQGEGLLEPREAGIGHAVARLHACHVVDHERYAQRGQHRERAQYIVDLAV